MKSTHWIGCALLMVSACKGGKSPATTDDMLTSWKEAGLEVGSFVPADSSGLGGGSCQAGPVAGLEVTLCEHPAPAQASTAKDQALAKVGSATGFSLSNDKWVLVVADRNQVDRNGKTMNHLALAFQGKIPPKPR